MRNFSDKAVLVAYKKWLEWKHEGSDVNGLVAMRAAINEAILQISKESDNASLVESAIVFVDGIEKGLFSKASAAGMIRKMSAALSALHAKAGVSVKETPANRWSGKGEPDPHGDTYSRERAALCGGHMTDDEIANAVYLDPSIGNLTSAKERIRWLSRSLSALSTKLQEPDHTDDLAVDRFAAAMKAKLAKKRGEGRGGWDDPEQCSIAFLSKLLREHVAKGDPVDVGNLAMMIHQRGGSIE